MQCATMLLVVAVASLAAAVCVAGPLEIPLTVRERLGVARAAEPVTSGVPLPKGAVKDVSELSLTEVMGKPVRAQFSVANRWWDDGSIKWLHVDFPVTLAANGANVFYLRNGADQAAGADVRTPLTVKETAAGFEVDTGVVRFTVKRQGFNLFDEVWLGGKQLVGSHDGGIVLKTAAGDATPATFADTKIAVEQQGPMKVVLLVTGQNLLADGGYVLDFKCRIYAFAGSPLVHVVYTVENRRGKWAEHVDLADWSIALPVKTAGGATCRFGLAEEPLKAKLSGDQSARVDVTATDAYRFSGAIEREGNPHDENPPWLGVLDVAGPDGGVTVGVKNFWQMWAKYLAADAAGNLTVGLWTDRARDKGLTTFVDAKGQVQFFAGVGRTHELYFAFHGGAAASLDAVAAAREPLFAACPPAWYCQGTKVFGDLSEADLSVYVPAWRDKVEKLNKWAEQSVDTALARWRSVKAGVNGAVDSFGMLNYGDSVEEYNDGTAPEKIHWEGGYYDYMHSILLIFARTGNVKYLWLANDMSRHNAEVHHTHHDQSPGHSRYCPSYAHIIMPDQGYYASGTFNHWKNLSIFERWYLLGDHRAREAALEVTQFAMRLGNDGIDWGQPRSICHGLLGFWAGYDATGEKRYMDAMAKFARAVAGRLEKGSKLGSGGWQRGMAMQGLCWYVEVSGDESVMPGIEKGVERDFSENPSELAYAQAFLWKRTGDAKFFEKAVRHLGGSPSQWMQRLGNNGRSKLYVPTIVRTDAPRKPPE